MMSRTAVAWLGLGLGVALWAGCSMNGEQLSSEGGGWAGGRETAGPSDANRGGQAGQLTAGAWDDNLNFEYFLTYLDGIAAKQLDGLLAIARDDRVVVRVLDGAGLPLAGAQVTLRDGGGDRLRTLTGGEGTALLLPAHDGVTEPAQAVVRATLGTASAEAPLPAAGELVLVLDGVAAAAVTGLDAVLLIDATGSMGDEAAYLLAEFDAITRAISDEFPGVEQRWGLVHYRDTAGDEYLVRRADFTADAGQFRARLAEVSAGGGGDYEEAVEEGVQSMVELSWRAGAVARLVFHVADAPHHADRTGRLLAPLRRAREQGIHIYPVASSGTDDRFEHTFRTFAQVTGGRYLFLTDDSGVGGEHAEPTLPCYRVTTLQRAMLRMIRIELSGVYTDADAADVIRVGGDPQDGRCTLQDGTQVRVF